MMRWIVKSTPLQVYYQVIYEAHPIQASTCGTHKIWVVCSGINKLNLMLDMR